MKPTKRKAFNFLRSYFDVLNELKTDADKLNFLLSIINKQFLNEEPEKLNFIVNLCYESQRHQIESSVKGWERASNETLGTTPPTTLGTTPPTTPKEEEEKGEEEEKVKNIYSVYPSYCKIRDRSTGKGQKDKDKIKKLLSSISEDELIKTIEWYIADCKQSKTYIKNFSTFLNNIPEVPTQQEKNKDIGMYDLINMYDIKKGDHYGFSSEQLIDRIKQGKYPLK